MFSDEVDKVKINFLLEKLPSWQINMFQENAFDLTLFSVAVRKHPRLGPFPHSVRASEAIFLALVRAALWMMALDHVQERRAAWAGGPRVMKPEGKD